MTSGRRTQALLAALMGPVLLGATLVMTAAPAGAAPTYTGYGFDTCAAPSLGTMTSWLASPYRSLGIYIGGANRACGDGNLSASWTASVEAQGWSLAPLYVGLQAPCVNQGGLALIDQGSEATEGAAAADDAAASAAGFGIPAGNALYFDMEGYGSDPGCVASVQAFLSSWAGELHRLGYLAGAYGSSSSTIHDQAVSPYPNRLDDIWFANWNGTPNLFGDPYFSDGAWIYRQRLHQYQGNVTETYSGVTLSIDRDYDQGAEAGPSDCGSAPPVGPARSAPAVSAPPVPAGGSAAAAAIPAWSAWATVRPAPCPAASAPAVASWAPGRVDLFDEGTDGHLWHAWSADSGTSLSAWEDLGSPPGGMTSSPAAVSWGPGRIDVMTRGADGALWQTSFAGGHWQAWTSLGGVLVSAPAVSSWGRGRLDVVAAGTDHEIWHTWYNGSWHGWEPLGGGAVGDPGLVSWGPGRVDLFTLGTGSVLYHRYYDRAGWSGWLQEVPGQWSSGPAATSWGPGRVDLFLESAAPGHPMAHAWYAAGWFVESQGGGLTAAPAAVATAPSRIDTFVLGTNANLWHKWYPT